MKEYIKKFLNDLLSLTSFIVIPVLLIFMLKYTYGKLGIQMFGHNHHKLNDGDLIIYYLLPLTILLGAIWDYNTKKHSTNEDTTENELNE